MLDTTPAREVDASLLPAGTRLATFHWVDDVAAARNAADALLTIDYVNHADCDEIVIGAEDLRALAAGVPLLGAVDCDPPHGALI